MNSGEIWNLMPADLQAKVKAVTKLTNNVGGGSDNKNAAVTATSDKLFLFSYFEIVPDSYWVSSCPWTSADGAQYEAFKGKVMNDYSGNSAIGSGWQERSVCPGDSYCFLNVYGSGVLSGNDYVARPYCACPAFCLSLNPALLMWTIMCVLPQYYTTTIANYRMTMHLCYHTSKRR